MKQIVKPNNVREPDGRNPFNFIPLPVETPPGEYRLQTGFYNWVNGERVGLHNKNEDVTPLCTIQIEEPE